MGLGKHYYTEHNYSEFELLFYSAISRRYQHGWDSASTTLMYLKPIERERGEMYLMPIERREMYLMPIERERGEI